MKQLDVYYRALLKFREQTQQNRQCIADSRAVARANPDNDKILLTRKHCIVNEDWVNAIEEGLKYIAKALAEERQFIYSNGQVVPIEMAKNISKESVVHLAKHSNLITREPPEGEDILPDQLYTVEKLNDYTVYENRFLYMLLCYLRDFITIRYNKILDLSNTYSGTMRMNKVVKTENRTMTYNVDFSEVKHDDDYLKETNHAKEIINRIDLLLKTVMSFFATPLMQVVSKAPMIKPPIVKTNVLKSNNNFKQALNLYGYLVAYDGDGYSVETEVKEISPFTDVIAGEMSETILLSSFITYEHSLGLESALKREYELEERRIKERALQEFREKLEAARQRVQKAEMSMEEYIVMLEKHIRALEKKAKELDQVKKELEETKALLEQTTNEKIQLEETLDHTIQELEAEKMRYITDMAALKLAHEEEINNIVTEYDNKIAEILDNHKNEIEALNEEFGQKIIDLKAVHAQEIDHLNSEHEQDLLARDKLHEQEISSLNESHQNDLYAKDSAITSLQEQLKFEKTRFSEQMQEKEKAHEKQINELTLKMKTLADQLDVEIKERRLLKAQYLALKKETGKLTGEDDHITELKFDELERTFELFKDYYQNEWKKAKRHIRRTVLKTVTQKKKPGDEKITVEESKVVTAPHSEPVESQFNVKSDESQFNVKSDESQFNVKSDESQFNVKNDEVAVTASTQETEAPSTEPAETFINIDALNDTDNDD